MSPRIGARPARYRALLAALGFTGPASSEWRERAACREVDPEAFYPVGTGPALAEQVAAVKAFCATCPVRRECLADAMASEDPASRWGVVGGLSPAERARVFAQRRDQVNERAGRSGPGRAVA